jgi:hypothetical protein
MNLSELSNYQLYGLIQNSKLDRSIREMAGVEFAMRKVTIEELENIISKHDTTLKSAKESLSPEFKTLLVLFPFILPFQSLIATRYLATGKKQKWKDYWLYIMMGYLLWTIIVVGLAKFVLFRHN